MTGNARHPLVAGNWKMNGTAASLEEVRLLDQMLKEGKARATVMVCPPATLISQVKWVLRGSDILVGAQDCHAEASGARTGDISAVMLKDAGCSAVIVGHSERRAGHGETDALVAAKARAVWRSGLIAIICIGETQAERKAGKTLDVLSRQIGGSVAEGASSANTIVAYEPVWAIGTGLTPTPAEVAEAHGHIRTELGRRYGTEADGMRLLYGGSVKPTNASELMAVTNVDGALVGGASLKAADFFGIIKAYC